MSGFGCEVSQVSAERPVFEEPHHKPRSVHVRASNAAALKIEKFDKQLDVPKAVRS